MRSSTWPVSACGRPVVAEHSRAAAICSFAVRPALWSVVVIARNEQNTVVDCLGSARAALGDRPHELILVDSASEDATVARAQTVSGVRVVRLPPYALLGPALGRYAGQQVARGDWLLFLDGDMTLLPGWLEAAEAVLLAEPELVGVAGALQHRLPDSAGGGLVEHSYPEDRYEDADHLGGSALYRRCALESVGGFNPFQRSGEEEELGARLRKAGYRLRRLRTPMSRHHPKHQQQTPRELWRRLRRGFYYGNGQLARAALSRRLPVIDPLRPVSRHLAFTALLLVGLGCLLAGLAGAGWWWLAAWTGLLTLLFLLFAVKTRGLRRPAYYFLDWALAGPAVTLGFFSRPRGVAEFLPLWEKLSAAVQISEPNDRVTLSSTLADKYE